MRPVSASALVMGLVFALSATSAIAVEGGKPFRHIVFKLGVSIQQQTDVHTSGGSVAGDDNVAGRPSGTQTEHASASMLSKGTVTVDIVGIDADRTLVADISEVAETRKAPVVRAIVYPNGVVEVGQADAENVTDEEHLLLHLLARDLVTPVAVQQGSWGSNQTIPNGRQVENYRVLSVAANGDVKLEVDQNTVVKDAHPYDIVTHGTIVYNATSSMPKNVSLAMRTHREGLQQTETTDQNVDFDLISDSLGN